MNVKPIKVFVSHSHDDVKQAEKLENAINESYLKLFLAHRDIEGGREWNENIRDEIGNCDMLLALITPNFYQSEYTGQEVGAAWMIEKPVLSVSVNNTRSSGFITGRQWVEYNQRYPSRTAGSIVKFALTEFHKHYVVDIAINMLNDSANYDQSNSIAYPVNPDVLTLPLDLAEVRAESYSSGKL